MLDAFVIEEIKRRERHREDRPVIELPLPVPPPPSGEGSRDDGGGNSRDRGVVIIDYG
jgi:hypothetical protein